MTSAASSSRSRRARATSPSVEASSSSTGRAAPRRIRTGSIGSTTAATASAIEPPVKASTARANEKWLAVGVTVKTSTADTATWLTNSCELPKKSPRATAIATANDSWTIPVPTS